MLEAVQYIHNENCTQHSTRQDSKQFAKFGQYSELIDVREGTDLNLCQFKNRTLNRPT